MQLKPCSKCNESKPTTAFYRDKSKADGLNTICKTCNDAGKRARISSNRQAYLDYHKQYRQTHRTQCREGQKRWRAENPDKLKAQRENNKEHRQEVKRAWDQRNKEHNRLKSMLRKLDSPEKTRARQQVYYATHVSGDLTKQNCQVCGELNAAAHHEDYSKPLDVTWMCTPCHNRLHKSVKPEVENGAGI